MSFPISQIIHKQQKTFSFKASTKRILSFSYYLHTRKNAPRGTRRKKYVGAKEAVDDRARKIC